MMQEVWAAIELTPAVQIMIGLAFVSGWSCRTVYGWFRGTNS